MLHCQNIYLGFQHPRQLQMIQGNCVPRNQSQGSECLSRGVMSKLSPHSMFIAPIIFVSRNMKALEGWVLYNCEWQHILEMSWLTLSVSSWSWVPAFVLILKGARAHFSLIKVSMNQKKRIFRYPNSPPEYSSFWSWVSSFMLILEGGRTNHSLVKVWVNKNTESSSA